MTAVVRPEDRETVTVAPPAALTGQTCYNCGAHVRSPRVECAPGIDLCVYCAEVWRGHIVSTWPHAKVIVGNMTFHLGQGGEGKK